jgi:predicted ATPase/class 3 adenylate cyclase
MKFCGECGEEIHHSCPHCGFTNPPNFKFCGNCGCELSVGKIATIDIPQQSDEISVAEDRQDENSCYGPDSERKCVTVMFSDLTGYTEMSEKLDPEEVKEVTSAIFSELTKIIQKYDGFIEKYIGDAILAVFGAKEAFEDSALRAIKAARELHAHVESVSPKYEKLIGRTLTMHTGINTGVVVTGEINFEKGTHGLVGDTINTAARLMGVAASGEIIIDHDSFVQTEGYFEFEILDPAKVKGKAEPIAVYRVGKALQEPKKLHRLHGLRAELIGRSVEMQILMDAAENLEQGKGSVVSVCGTAGTGKSRLVHEFKKTLDLKKVQWFDANAYHYTQNTPYYPLIDLLTKAFDIKDGDNSEAIKLKVESSLEGLLGKGSGNAPYIGSLFSIEYSETKEVSPEYWKDRLYAAIGDVLKALTAVAPTVICLEDMHWADPSTMELVRKLVSNLSDPLMVVCIYRPVITIFTDFEINTLPIDYTELRLRELSPSESQDMICSLLNADQIPKELRGFIRDSIDGNPFYVEELINALIDSEALSKDSGQWVLTKTIDDSFISTNIQGVIAGRIDRLGRDTKRILQEASVIGRAFLFDILQRISETKQDIDKNLMTLERLDLISAKSIQPTLEYIFKHALTQEIVYNGLVKSERRLIHEKIGNVIEILFQDRLTEFYETLAYHFSRGQSVTKAVDYLVKSGEKSLARYSVEEANQYFRKAYDIIAKIEALSEAEKIVIIDILNSWGYVYYYLGEIKEWIELLKSHQSLAESLRDKARLGMFYAWLGCALITAGKPKDAYVYLRSALELGEKSSAQKVVGYACTWLSWACGWLGSFEEGITYGMRAQEIAESFLSDQYLFFKSFSAICYINYCQGKTKLLFEEAKRLLDYGERTANSRSKVFGYWMKALGYMARGEIALARKESENSIGAAVDPFYSQFGKSTLGMSYIFDGQLKEAEDTFRLISDYCEKRGLELMSQFSNLFLSFIDIPKGNMEQGFRRFKETQEVLLKNHMKVWYATSESMLGAVYTRLIIGPSPSLATVAKNIGFIVKNAPFADRKAEESFKKAIENCREMGAKGNLGQALLGLGRLHKAKKRNEKASECFSEAIHLFQKCDAHVFLKQAKEELASI